MNQSRLLRRLVAMVGLGLSIFLAMLIAGGCSSGVTPEDKRGAAMRAQVVAPESAVKHADRFPAPELTLKGVDGVRGNGGMTKMGTGALTLHPVTSNNSGNTSVTSVASGATIGSAGAMGALIYTGDSARPNAAVTSNSSFNSGSYSGGTTGSSGTLSLNELTLAGSGTISNSATSIGGLLSAGAGTIVSSTGGSLSGNGTLTGGSPAFGNNGTRSWNASGTIASNGVNIGGADGGAIYTPSTQPGIPYNDILRYPDNWPDVGREKSGLEQFVANARAQQSYEEFKANEAKRQAVESYAQARTIAGSLPSRCEELWIIGRDAQAMDEQAKADDLPGSGALIAKDKDGVKDIPVPLKHTAVRANIAGYIASVDVIQQYHNPFDTKIEAVYVFPLPHNSAVNEFVMTIGDRHIRGLIRERKEAERVYVEAKSQGMVASLLTQERPNIFTQSIANIEPGKKIDIEIKYFHTLEYRDGAYEFVFPMVVGPRFNPSHIMDGVGAVARGAQGTSSQKTEVQYLKPTERSGHDISMIVNVDAGVPIESLECKSHTIAKKEVGPGKSEVILAQGDQIPNRDFVLRYAVAGKTTKSAIITQRESRGGYFTMTLYPPAELQHLPRKPLELVFVVDVSGSQQGLPLEQEKAGVRYALKNMSARDTFQIIKFSDQTVKFAAEPVTGTPENVARALAWVNALQTEGGTMLTDGVKAALEFPHDPERLRFVSFMTDGFIGNEGEALNAIQKSLGPARIFSLGVGNSTNRYLLDHMAKIGKGAVAYLSTKDSADEIMSQFLDRISHPALTDISVDWGDMKVEEVYPQRIPDLFVGRPVVITGRFKGEGKPTVKIRGMAGNEKREIAIATDLDDKANTHAGVSTVWARAKIGDLYDRSVCEAAPQLPGQIRQLAMEYSLMSPYTAFLAVDSTRKTEGDHGVTVPIAVPVPDGVRYDTTVPEKRIVKREE